MHTWVVKAARLGSARLVLVMVLVMVRCDST